MEISAATDVHAPIGRYGPHLRASLSQRSGQATAYPPLDRDGELDLESPIDRRNLELAVEVRRHDHVDTDAG